MYVIILVEFRFYNKCWGQAHHLTPTFIIEPELETLMPWAPDIQQDHKIPNSDAYTKCYLD